MKGPILGWDVGGANVKVARLEDGGDVSAPKVLECPFPIWRNRDALPGLLAGTAERLGRARNMAVTMTAELADCFATKREGVLFVLDAFRAAFPGVEPWIYGIDGRFRSDARQQGRLAKVRGARARRSRRAPSAALGRRVR